MSKHRLQPLLKPSSIAVIGASQKTGSVGNEVFKNLKRGGFEGELVGVNPWLYQYRRAGLLPHS
jgi:acetyltransferase